MKLQHSWPHQVVTPEVRLPMGWIRCPLCGLHYVIKGKAHPRLCSLIDN